MACMRSSRQVKVTILECIIRCSSTVEIENVQLGGCFDKTLHCYCRHSQSCVKISKRFNWEDVFGFVFYVWLQTREIAMFKDRSALSENFATEHTTAELRRREKLHDPNPRSNNIALSLPRRHGDTRAVLCPGLWCFISISTCIGKFISRSSVDNLVIELRNFELEALFGQAGFFVSVFTTWWRQ